MKVEEGSKEENEESVRGFLFVRNTGQIPDSFWPDIRPDSSQEFFF